MLQAVGSPREFQTYECSQSYFCLQPGVQIGKWRLETVKLKEAPNMEAWPVGWEGSPTLVHISGTSQQLCLGEQPSVDRSQALSHGWETAVSSTLSLSFWMHSVQRETNLAKRGALSIAF